MQTGFQKVIDVFFRALEALMVACLVVMFIMVFGNVVLRIGFNTGIDLSEEMPRFAFIWMTFIGAIVGMRHRAHLGVDMVVQMLPRLGRKVCWGISQFIMLICCGYMVYGTYLQHDIIRGNASPVAQLSMVWVLGISYLTGSVIGVMCAYNIVRLFLGRVADDELCDVTEEGMAESGLANESATVPATAPATGGRS
jgi:TRAP-type transport system small permease protein